MRQFRKLFLLIIAIIIAVSTIVYAHPGRTDSNGGHWDRSTGTYHFHTGEYAGRNSSGSSNSEYIPFTPPSDPPAENPYKNENAEKSKDNNTVLMIISAIIGIPFGILFCVSILHTLFLFIVLPCQILLEKHSPKWKLSQYEQAINNVLKCTQEFKECAKIIKSQSPIYTIPPEYEIGSDNLPKEKNSSGWGSTFTVYTKGFYGGKIHSKFNCSNATIKCHVYKCLGGYFPERLCRRCAFNYQPPDFTWYEEYLKHQSATNQYESLKTKYSQSKSNLILWHRKCNSKLFKVLILFNKKSKGKHDELNNAYWQALRA